MKTDVSIEYGHIYTDMQFSVEHIISIEEKNRITAELDIKGSDYQTVIMVDDYSPEDGSSFNYTEFESKLKEYYGSPDVIILESDLVNTNMYVIDLMKDNSLKRQLLSNIERNERHPCSLFITSWYLIRLGLIENDFNISPCIDLINILDSRFKEPENNAKKIISSIFGKETLDRITNIYL